VRTPLRLVLDTNVWLDWLVFDDPSIDFGRKRTLDAARRDACLALCRQVARRIESAVPGAERARLPACRDPDDQKFLEAALAARAEFLVTKDRALLDLARQVAHFHIVAPEAFEKADPSRSLS